MKKHPYRAFFIWAVLVVALINIYPTVGWMALSDEARQARLTAWSQEDDEYAKERPSTWQKFYRSAKRWVEFDRNRVINLGLDLQGGVHMVLGFDINDLPEDRLKEYRDRNYTDDQIRQEVQDVVLQQITRRVNDFEAKEPIIQTQGTTQIQVQLPGEKDVERAQRLITKVAQLNFHTVAGSDETFAFLEKVKQAHPEEFVAFLIPPTRSGEPLRTSVENYDRAKRLFEQASEEKLLPEGKTILFSQTPKAFEEQFYSLYVVDTVPLMPGEGLSTASAIPDQANPPYWEILFGFGPEAAATFGEVTKANIGRAMAIVVDNVVVAAPVIRDQISANGSISGSFEGEEARDLAIALNSGSMVVPVREEYTGVVGATLGRDSIRKGVMSSLAGLALVAAFVLVYYRAAGLIAVICLAINAILVIAAMAYFGMTLTLPGIAGLILSIGMAVDANVLIYERLREELALGHTLLSSVESGFKRAAVTILDANVTTLIAAIVLFQFGTGPIEGFAITLSIGVLASVFTALVVSKAMFDAALSRGLIKHLTMMSIIPNDRKIAFMGARNVCMAVSAVAIVLSMSYFFYRGWDNFGVDFTQGTSLKLTLLTESEVDTDAIRGALGDAGFSGPQVQRSSSDLSGLGNTFLVRVGDVGGDVLSSDGTEPAGKTISQRVQDALAPLTGKAAAEGVELDDVQTVGPSVGAQLRGDALEALFWSLFMILLYVTFRFEWKFAAGAVVALVHDLLIVVGIMSLLGRQISMPTIAALLTIVGYSLNDTIVVFDRIREDIKLYRGKGYKLAQLMDIAINATLSRTMLTSGTTLFVVVVLYFFGGDSINDFALALILGIGIGTYSSIFIASPVVHMLDKYFAKAVDTSDGTPTDSSRRRRKSSATGDKPAKSATA